MGRTLQIQTPRAYVPLLQPSRYKGAHGGRGSAKSHWFGELLLEKCVANEGTRAVCVREVQKSLEQSVKRLLEDKIKAFGAGNQFRVMDTHIETPGDGIIIFQGMQNHTAESIKSLEGYDVAWVEEAQSLSERSLTLLRPTIRKPASEIWFSWNPQQPTDPVDKLLRSAVIPPDAIVIKTSWRDNPWFPEVLRKELEWDRTTDVEKYEHVWEGEYEKHSEARVFKNWRIEEFETPPNTTFYIGADWGYSIDPTTLVRAFVQLVNPATGQPWARKRLYIDRDLFRIGVEVDDIPKFFDGLVCGCDPMFPHRLCVNEAQHAAARPWPIVADSARPETISYLRRHGYPRMEPAKKGANSVKEGVIFLQGYDIIIHPRCTHTVDEFKNFSYVKDPLTGIITPVLADKKNHIIDPVRYALEQVRGALVVKKTVWG
jgi:phage terminase large subunit